MQTIPAVGPFAFQELLGHNNNPVTLVIDTKYIINKWQKIRNLQITSEGSNPEIWTQIATHQNGKISLIKIKHLYGSDNIWQWWINLFANNIYN